MDTRLLRYHRLVEQYFEMEFSDVPLGKVLLRLPDSYIDKVDQLIRLHHRVKKTPADAAAFMMRLFSSRVGCLIAGQQADR